MKLADTISDLNEHVLKNQIVHQKNKFKTIKSPERKELSPQFEDNVNNIEYSLGYKDVEENEGGLLYKVEEQPTLEGKLQMKAMRNWIIDSKDNLKQNNLSPLKKFSKTIEFKQDHLNGIKKKIQMNNKKKDKLKKELHTLQNLTNISDISSEADEQIQEKNQAVRTIRRKKS